MKWLAHIAALTLLATAIGCGGVSEVDATTGGAAPTDDEMAKYAEETAKHMPGAGQGGSDPNAAMKQDMMKKAMEGAPGGQPPSQ